MPIIWKDDYDAAPEPASWTEMLVCAAVVVAGTLILKLF
jgi:hypothetical protein